MTALSTRDMLVTALQARGRSHAWSAETTDALFASGAVIDAAALADDEALVERIWRETLTPKNRFAVRSVLRALAAALTERGA